MKLKKSKFDTYHTFWQNAIFPLQMNMSKNYLPKLEFGPRRHMFFFENFFGVFLDINI